MFYKIKGTHVEMGPDGSPCPVTNSAQPQGRRCHVRSLLPHLSDILQKWNWCRFLLLLHQPASHLRSLTSLHPEWRQKPNWWFSVCLQCALHSKVYVINSTRVYCLSSLTVGITALCDWFILTRLCRSSGKVVGAAHADAGVELGCSSTPMAVCCTEYQGWNCLATPYIMFPHNVNLYVQWSVCMSSSLYSFLPRNPWD